MDIAAAWLTVGKIYLYLEEARMRRKMMSLDLNYHLEIFIEFRHLKRRKRLLQLAIFMQVL